MFLRAPIFFRKLSFSLRSVMHKSTLQGRSRKDTYRRVDDLDKVMDMRKKPSMILRLKSIIQSQKRSCILLRDLEKEVGFVQKWKFMSLISKCPSIFHVGGSPRTPAFVTLTDRASEIAEEEIDARKEMEPILVKNLKKLLMLSVDCAIPMESVRLIGDSMGLPSDFRDSLIPNYPQLLSVKISKGIEVLQLENWDSSLAVTSREENLSTMEKNIDLKGRKRFISKDGNFEGPFAFKLCFPPGFRPNMDFLKEVYKWQKMEFPSPYLSAERFDSGEKKAKKRMIGVLHELLSLTMEKRLTCTQIDAFHYVFKLPSNLEACLIKHHGVFYLTNKWIRGTVFLKEAYEQSNLVGECPLLRFNRKFLSINRKRSYSTCLLHD